MIPVDEEAEQMVDKLMGKRKPVASRKLEPRAPSSESGPPAMADAANAATVRVDDSGDLLLEVTLDARRAFVEEWARKMAAWTRYDHDFTEPRDCKSEDWDALDDADRNRWRDFVRCLVNACARTPAVAADPPAPALPMLTLDRLKLACDRAWACVKAGEVDCDEDMSVEIMRQLGGPVCAPAAPVTPPSEPPAWITMAARLFAMAATPSLRTDQARKWLRDHGESDPYLAGDHEESDRQIAAAARERLADYAGVPPSEPLTVGRALMLPEVRSGEMFVRFMYLDTDPVMLKAISGDPHISWTDGDAMDRWEEWAPEPDELLLPCALVCAALASRKDAP